MNTTKEHVDNLNRLSAYRTLHDQDRKNLGFTAKYLEALAEELRLNKLIISRAQENILELAGMAVSPPVVYSRGAAAKIEEANDRISQMKHLRNVERVIWLVVCLNLVVWGFVL